MNSMPKLDGTTGGTGTTRCVPLQLPEHIANPDSGPRRRGEGGANDHDEKEANHDGEPESHRRPTKPGDGKKDDRKRDGDAAKDDDSPRKDDSEKNGSDKKHSEKKEDSEQKDDPAKKDDPEKAESKKPTKKHLRWLYFVAAVLVLTCAVGATVIVYRHHHRVQAQAAALNREVDKGPRVAVTKVQPGVPDRMIVLPGDARAVVQTTIYSKTSGYVREIRVDKGDHVKKGDILAIVESPETDQQVESARSDLNLKEKVATRAHALVVQGLISTQDRETADANQEVSRANLKRTLALAGYEVIRAPFSGVVSARYVDPGALLPAATGATQSALPLIDIVDPDTLKATVFVGQDLAPFVRAGDGVDLWQDEKPEQKIHATITRASGSLDPKTRTMLVEVYFNNKDAGIYPGTFVRVALKTRISPLPTVPSDALFVRKGNLMIGRIEGDHLKFVPVQIGVNTGKMTQITSGVTGGEDIALDVPSESEDGARVQVVDAPASASANPSSAPSASPSSAPSASPSGTPSASPSSSPSK